MRVVVGVFVRIFPITVGNSSSAGVMFGVIRRVEALKNNAFVRVGGVNELVASDIYADMRYALAVGITEKYQIPRPHIWAFDRAALIVLLDSSARYFDAGGVTKYVAGKARAIESRSACSPELVP